MGINKEELVKRLENLNAVEKRAISIRRAVEKEWEQKYNDIRDEAVNRYQNIISSAFPSRIISAAVNSGGEFGQISSHIVGFGVKKAEGYDCVCFEIKCSEISVPVHAVFEPSGLRVRIHHNTKDVKCQNDIDVIQMVLDGAAELDGAIPMLYETIAQRLEKDFLQGIEDLPQESQEKLKAAMLDENTSLYQSAADMEEQ